MRENSGSFLDAKKLYETQLTSRKGKKQTLIARNTPCAEAKKDNKNRNQEGSLKERTNQLFRSQILWNSVLTLIKMRSHVAE